MQSFARILYRACVLLCKFDRSIFSFPLDSVMIFIDMKTHLDIDQSWLNNESWPTGNIRSAASLIINEEFKSIIKALRILSLKRKNDQRSDIAVRSKWLNNERHLIWFSFCFWFCSIRFQSIIHRSIDGNVTLK